MLKMNEMFQKFKNNSTPQEECSNTIGYCVYCHSQFLPDSKESSKRPSLWRPHACHTCGVYLEMLAQRLSPEYLAPPTFYSPVKRPQYNSLFFVNGLIEIYYFTYQDDKEIYSYEDAINSYEDARIQKIKNNSKIVNCDYLLLKNEPDTIPDRMKPKPENEHFKHIQFKGYYNNNTKWFEGECKYYNFDGSLQYITIFQNDDYTKPRVQHIYIKE